MATLMKPKRKRRIAPWSNRLVTPWSNSLLTPWKDRLIDSSFDDLRDLMKFDKVFKDDFIEEDSLVPAMNVKEHKDALEIEFAVPGFEKKDFEVSIEEDILHISGEKEDTKEEKEEDYSCKEFSYKSFKRSLSLPDSADLDQDVKASYTNGILNIKLLKKEGYEEERPKKVIAIN